MKNDDYIPFSRFYTLMDFHNINKAVNLCNFNDKKNGRAILINSEQVDKWGFALRRNLNSMDFYRIGSSCPLSNQEYVKISNRFKPRLYSDDIHILGDLFEITNGKMSLCGGAILSLIQFQIPKDYDFFFHCDSVSEADDMLKLCMQTIHTFYAEMGDEYAITYSRSLSTQTVVIASQFDISDTIKIQFIRRNYQHKDQVLLGFDLPCCQYGYNDIDGFFTTIPGGITLASGMFSLDLTQRSLSFAHRLRKYSGKGFLIVFPGIKSMESDIRTPDGRLSESYNKILDFMSNEYKDIYWNEEVKGSETRFSDYDGEPQNNWYYIASNRPYNVTFSTKKWKKLYDMPDKTIRKRLFNGAYYYNKVDVNEIKLKHATLFLGDKIGDYITALVQNKKKVCEEIWKNKIVDYQDKAISIYNNMITEPWRHINPGSQSFGKNNPIITNPRDWFGPTYDPTIVGISNERLIALNSCLKGCPKEIIKIICDYWLVAEAKDAFNYLLDIKSDVEEDSSAEEEQGPVGIHLPFPIEDYY